MLRDAAANLEHFSEKLPIVPELGAPCRERLVVRYRLIYRVQENQVVVLALEHGARDLLENLGHRFLEES